MFLVGPDPDEEEDDDDVDAPVNSFSSSVEAEASGRDEESRAHFLPKLPGMVSEKQLTGPNSGMAKLSGKCLCSFVIIQSFFVLFLVFRLL